MKYTFSVLILDQFLTSTLTTGAMVGSQSSVFAFDLVSLGQPWLDTMLATWLLQFAVNNFPSQVPV